MNKSMIFINRTFYLLLVSVAMTACAARPTLNEDTPSQTFRAPVDQVYQASVDAFLNLGLEVFKEDKSSQYIEGGRRPAFGQGSENVGVFLEAVGASETIVRIDNNRAVMGMLFSEDWTDDLFNQINIELESWGT